jgi:hypothetical protein
MIAEKCADMLLQDAGVTVTLPEGLSQQPRRKTRRTGAAVTAE